MENLCAGYGDKVILEKIKMNLVPGSRIGLLGRNGAGKSTFIKMLSAPMRRSRQAGGERRGQHRLLLPSISSETLRLDDTCSITWPASRRQVRAGCATTSAASASHGDKALDKVAPSPAARGAAGAGPHHPAKAKPACCWMNRPTT